MQALGSKFWTPKSRSDWQSGKVQETGGIRLENTFSEQRFGNAGCLQNGKLPENEGPHKNKKDKSEKNENIY